MTNNSLINTLATGVPGLDDVLGGGLPEYSFNLIAGPPGCGKTTLAHQMMFALAAPERPALYFTVLGEPPLKMLRYQQQFAFFDAQKINASIHFINLSDVAVTGDLGAVLEKITEEVESRSPAFVFVDSFRSVVLSHKAPGDPYGELQRFVQHLGMLMTSWQATTFLIGEYFNETDANPVFTVADGLIWLRQSVQRNSMVRKLELLKMRGRPTMPGLHTFRIDGNGVHVFAPVGQRQPSTAAQIDRSAGQRLSIGVPDLDDMLGGGIPPGYSILVSGPSGSGKSLLAAAFLQEGARNGETGVIAMFEQQPVKARNEAVAALIAADRVGVVDSRVPDLSVDEIVPLIVAEIARLQATRVVIDSLSGFELSLAPTFRADFREALSRFVTALADTGVTVLMTCELEDRYTDLRFSPYGTAFLTDVIIVQRYIEMDSRLRRMMSVVKIRASAHSDQIRLFTIDDAGIKIGDTLEGLEGLMGGRPTHKRL
ncbi:ATPase domain-containing protein [Pseudorhodoferax sp. Leaf274]|uniref:ATPase domain-containing protein n=1 Tax=Pseudorhodoferax sp. Leaf274 TaxID=1736318 RepID=UPI00070350BC|nr:ATPase domain-containing protein [Pseudorhodoferax sp. Leaf274]KQP49125.1 protein kinase [Pseudorhodoferax sp. Leaf274]